MNTTAQTNGLSPTIKADRTQSQIVFAGVDGHAEQRKRRKN